MRKSGGQVEFDHWLCINETVALADSNCKAYGVFALVSTTVIVATAVFALLLDLSFFWDGLAKSSISFFPILNHWSMVDNLSH